MADAAACMADAGAEIVDINLGCPAPRAVRAGCGAAMLKDLSLLGRVLSAMRRRVPGTLSAKIRAGWDTRDHVLEIGKVVEDCGADFVVVHPRRRTDFFEGAADWRPIALLTERLSIPVIGNGDVWYAHDALRMERETGCAGVMLGRPALRNPWIFSQIEALRRGETPHTPSGAEVHDYLRDVMRRFADAFPSARYDGIGRIKELVSWLGRAVDDGREFRTKALRAGSVAEILGHAEAIAALPAERLDLDASGRFRFERSGSVAVTGA